MSLVSAKIEDVCLVGDGAHASIKRVSEGVPYLTSKNFKIEGLDLSKLDYISKEDYDKHFNGKSKAITKPIFNDIMLSIIGSIGSPHLVRNSDEFGLSSSVSILRPNEDKILPSFLYYWLKSSFFQQSIQQIKSGVAQSFLSLGMIRSLPVNYFESLKTQKRIADILSAYDDLIENNLKRIELLEQAAQNIYKEWFVNLRFPGHKNTPINEETGLPEGWGEKEINSIITFLGGYAFKSKTYIESGKYKVITIKNVGDKVFNTSVGNSVDSIPDKMKEHCKIIEGDILLSLTGNVGRSCIAYGENNLLNQRVAKIVPTNKNWLPYIYWMFNDNKIFSLMNNLATGAAQQNLSPVKLAKEKVVLPSESVIDLYCLKANSVFKQIILLNKQNQKLKVARDILLPRLMNRTIEI